MNRTKRIYRIWAAMNTRCNKKNHKAYSYYGGRGIKLLWLSFADFKNDMNESYEQHVREYGEYETVIDRINNNGNYCKENCRWATRKENLRNTRKNRILIYKGESKTLSAWEEQFGIKRHSLQYRLDAGWDIEKALLTPFPKRKKSIELMPFKSEIIMLYKNGLRQKYIAKKYGSSQSTIGLWLHKWAKEDSSLNFPIANKKERNPAAKLTQKDVDRIRYYLAKNIKQKTLAIKFSVCQTQISNINRGKQWKDNSGVIRVMEE